MIGGPATAHMQGRIVCVGPAACRARQAIARRLGTYVATKYQEFHRRRVEQPEAFWSKQAELIEWHKSFVHVLDYFGPPFTKWFVAILQSLCVGRGDRVLIYMPMIPEAIFAMLATVRFGAILDYASLREQHLDARVQVTCLESKEPSYILYTSGTTGRPKGV